MGIKLQRTFRAIAEQPPEPRLDRVLVDFSASSNSEVRKEFISANSNNKFVDVLTSRVPQPELWKMYRRYRWVVSMPGNGLDSHRSWEAVYQGAKVLVPEYLFPDLRDQEFFVRINPYEPIGRDALNVGNKKIVCPKNIANGLKKRFIDPLCK